MSIMYKYFNIEILNNFIECPTLKLTNPSELNDPFESSISKDIVNIYKNIRAERDSDCLPIGMLQNIANSMGIISLTNTQDNKLMWAHYANSHTGFVIGFDTEKLNKYISSINLKAPLVFPSPSELHKVKYTSERFNCDSLINEESKELDAYGLASHIITLVSTTKSEDWKYEEEYRYILSPDFCDNIRIKIKGNSLYFNSVRKNILKNFKAERSHFYNSKTNEYLDVDESFYFKNEILIDDKLNALKDLNIHKPIRLMSIPKECITSIYLGACIEEKNIRNLIYQLKKHPEYEKVEVIKYNVCNNTFNLNPEIPPYPSAEDIDNLFLNVEKYL